MPGTLARLFRHMVSYDKPDTILTKSEGVYRPISARELYRRVGRLHFGLRKAGLSKGDRCALLSENRWEWAVADFAMMTAGIVSVPLYPTLSAEQLHYMLEHSEARAVLLSTREHLEKIQCIWDRLPCLQGALVFDSIEAGDSRVITLHDVIGHAALTEEEKTALEESISAIQPEDLASIIYTSGTTGVPKGVMLTHGNFATNVRDNGLDLRTSDVGLSFLPLCHVAERTADYAYFYNGMTVAYAESIEAVPQNLAEVHPTIVVGVPRFFEKMYAKVMGAVAASSKARQTLFHWALGVGRAAGPYLLEHRRLPWVLHCKHALADRLVFSKLRGRLGGRIRFFISGSAPLAKHLGEFFFSVGVRICEGYGLTETSPLVSINRPENLRFGTVGKVIDNVEVKIADDGEILVRGPNVMKGYYKMEEATRRTIVDGWLHTGDIGKFDGDGYLIITDRKKDLFKTSGGKYIAPQPIENQLKTSVYISTAVVIAEGRRFPSALLVPDFEQLERFAAEKGIDCSNRAELTGHPAIQELIEKEVAAACSGLAEYERIKKFIVIEKEFSIENGEITPTMKVRRREVEKRYTDKINLLYT